MGFIGIGDIALDIFDGVIGVPIRLQAPSDAVTFHEPPGVSERGRISARLLLTMPVTPTTRPTLSKFLGASSPSNFFCKNPEQKKKKK